MQLRCLLLSGCVAAAESSFWGSVLGSRSQRLGLEPSAGFLQKKKARAEEAPDQKDLAARALARDALGVGDGLVLAQKEARLIVDKRKARAPADTIEAAAKRKLEESPVEPLRPLNSGVLDVKASPENATGTPSSRASVSKKWDEIKSAQQEAKKAVTEGADSLMDDESVKHLMSWEAMLISNIATGEDEHAQPCIAHCRYGEEARHSWQECVERCVEDGMTRRMLLVGLPEGEREAAKLDAPLPAGMDELKKKRKERRRARSEDL